MKNRDIVFVIRMRNEAKRSLNALRTNLRQVAQAARTASTNLKKMSTDVTTLNAKGRIGGQIFTGLQRALGALGVGIGLAAGIRTLADFSQGMSTVAAITNATDSQFQQLRASAKDLGATTRFTATQAAEGMLFLARAGFDTNAVLASIEGTLQLAQAGALDLGRAADIASNILTGFRLNVDQTGRVVDVLALAANSSNTNVEQLGDAMKFVAPVAAGLGVQIEEAAGAVAALSDAGLQGSLAGTGLRRVLSELESPSIKTLQIFRALGVQANEVRVSQVGLTAALERLRDAGVDTGTALEIFGDRGGPAFEVLNSSIPKVVAMTEKLKEADGTAKRVAETMDANLNGALKRVASAAEAVVIGLGDIGAESGLTVFLNATASALRAVAGNADLLLKVILAAAVGLTARFAPALVATTAKMLGLSGATTAAAGAFGLLKVALKGIALFALVTVIERIITGLADLGKETEAGVTKWQLLGAAASGVFKTLGEGLSRILQSIGLFGRALGALLSGELQRAGQLAKEGAENAGSILGLSFKEGIERELTELAKTLRRDKFEKEFLSIYADAVDELANPPSGLLKKASDGGKRVANAFFEGIKQFGGFGNFANALDQIVQNFAPAISREKEQAEALKVLEVAAKATDATLRDLGLTRQQLIEVTDKVRAGLEKETGEIIKATREAQKRIDVAAADIHQREIEEKVIEATNAAKEKGEKIDQQAIATLRERLKLAQQAEARNELNSGLKDTLRGIQDEIALLGVNEQQRRRIVAVQQLKNRAQKEGIQDIQEELRLLNEQFDKLDAAEKAFRGDAVGGVKDALEKMRLEAEDARGAMERLTLSVADGLNDAITEFAETGKFAFSDFVSSALRDLQKLATNKIFLSLGDSLFGGAGGGAGGGTGGGFGSLISSVAGFLFREGGVVGQGGIPAMLPAAAFAGAERFQAGGRVGRGRDTVPILAAPGEVILTEDQAQNLARALNTRGVGNLAPINSNVGGGGGTGGDTYITVQAPITVQATDARSFQAPETQSQIARGTARNLDRALRRNGP